MTGLWNSFFILRFPRQPEGMLVWARGRDVPGSFPAGTNGADGIGSEALEDIIVGAVVDFPERGQLAYTDVVVASLDVGVEVPCHVNPFCLHLRGHLLLGEASLFPQSAEVGADAVILLYFLAHIYPQSIIMCGNPHF